MWTVGGWTACKGSDPHRDREILFGWCPKMGWTWGLAAWVPHEHPPGSMPHPQTQSRPSQQGPQWRPSFRTGPNTTPLEGGGGVAAFVELSPYAKGPDIVSSEPRWFPGRYASSLRHHSRCFHGIPTRGSSSVPIQHHSAGAVHTPCLRHMWYEKQVRRCPSRAWLRPLKQGASEAVSVSTNELKNRPCTPIPPVPPVPVGYP